MSLTTRAVAATLAAAVVTAPGVAQAAGPTSSQAPVHAVAVAADTSSPAPTTTTTSRPVTQGEGGDKTFGYLLGAAVLAVFAGGAAWMLRSRRRTQ